MRYNVAFFQPTRPNRDGFNAPLAELLNCLDVPLASPVDLRVPEIGVGRRSPTSAAIMPVPEAAVYKYRNVEAPDIDVRLTREVLAMQPIANTA